MRFLASYAMRGLMQATLVVTVAALLSLALPPLSFLSGGTFALVTLHLGVRRSAILLLSASLATALFGLLLFGNMAPALGFALVLWLPMLLLGGVLRSTVSLSLAVLLAGGLGVGLVLAMYLGLSDPGAWWQGVVQTLFVHEAGQHTEDAKQLVAVLKAMAPQIAGVFGASLAMSLIGALLLGRWWQALLYNPGGFRDEFQRLRLGRPLAVLALALVSAASLSEGMVGHLATDLLLVVEVLLLMQGLAMSHGLVARSGAHPAWLIALYVLLVIAMPQAILTLALAGFADNWFDFRAFFGKKGAG